MESINNRIELLGVIAHPARIKILEELTEGVKCVSDFENSLDISQPNISQHLILLRNHGIVDYYVDGRLRCYFLVEPIITDILGLLRKNYPDKLPRPSCCPVTKKGKYPGRKSN